MYLISVLSFYIILSVGLSLFPKIGCSSNSENINQVSLNLSYSYVAGLIFYFFISYIPINLLKRKLRPTLKSKFEDLSNQVCSYIQTFENIDIEIDVKTINFNFIKSVMESKSILDSSYYSKIMALKMNNLEFINSTKESIFNLIDSALVYKEYLDAEEILHLEKIKDSKFFHLLKIKHNNLLGNIYYNSDSFKNEFITELNDIFVSVKKLKK